MYFEFLGSGINPDNIEEIAELTGAVEFHSSGQDPLHPRVIPRSFIVRGTDSYPQASVFTVQRMRQILTRLQQEKN
ncbi:hypothetical protein TNCV_2676411 [Trichonephila clavipes]|nr:hypothetical protein TNCV_2676411 [Trichonephila clavipes]